MSRKSLFYSQMGDQETKITSRLVNFIKLENRNEVIV